MLAATVGKRRYTFKSLYEAMAKANEEKSGDRLAGIAAGSLEERVAAKRVIAEIPLSRFIEEPAIPYDEDEVTRVILDDLDRGGSEGVAGKTVAGLREWLLRTETTPEAIARVRPGLTPEMAAAAAKTMSTLDLVLASKKCPVVVRARTTLGLPGRLGSRIQPNHPGDSAEGVQVSILEGLAYGSGDALIGVNPVEDTLESFERLSRTIQEVIDRHEVPTQNCVLAHLTTQIRAMENRLPVGLVFQSLAGTEAGNRGFGVSVALLDEAAAAARERSLVRGEHRFYFETGEGSELSADAHAGIDQLTLEARCYGLARRYRPFVLNSVVGFIGPEYLADGRQVTRAGLEDHFMGKLLGIPMGVDACYT
ncbi:MAG: ethanolamine ammonia-lyase subunit EutB, partial [Vicinamibacteria bacterium]